MRVFRSVCYFFHEVKGDIQAIFFCSNCTISIQLWGVYENCLNDIFCTVGDGVYCTICVFSQQEEPYIHKFFPLCPSVTGRAQAISSKLYNHSLSFFIMLLVVTQRFHFPWPKRLKHSLRSRRLYTLRKK